MISRVQANTNPTAILVHTRLHTCTHAYILAVFLLLFQSFGLYLYLYLISIPHLYLCVHPAQRGELTGSSALVGSGLARSGSSG